MKGPPAFIVGCGRSGTTALGRLLSDHPDVRYLNEPRKIWRIDPRTDVWTDEATSKASLDLYDVEQPVRAELRKAFFKRVPPEGRLVEKTPVNSYRLDYLRALFPNGRFLHLLRSGLDVARSIQRWVEGGQTWYGKGDIKWRLLTDYAGRHGLGDLAEWAGEDPRRRGLLEWRTAVTHTRERLSDKDLEIRYEDLVGDPRREVTRIADWVGIDGSGLDANSLAARNEPERVLDEDAKHAAGDLLTELGYA